MRVPTYVPSVFITSPFDSLFIQDQTLLGILRAVFFISLLFLLKRKNTSFVITICLWVTITTSKPPDISGNVVRTVCPWRTLKILKLCMGIANLRKRYYRCSGRILHTAIQQYGGGAKQLKFRFLTKQHS